MKKLLGNVRRIIDDYDMIKENDRIAVGVSGGKDSVATLLLLNELSRFYPRHFTVIGIMLDMGFPDFDNNTIENFFKNRSIEFHTVKTNIGEIVFNRRNEKNPCSLCSNMKRGALHNAALDLGINKVALGHHNDDAVETFIMNIIFEGRIGCFSPVTYLDKKDITVIRPMLYVKESEISSFIKRYDVPIVKSNCPQDGFSSREDIKNQIKEFEKNYPDIKQKIISAIQKSQIDGWNFFPKSRKKDLN